MNARWLIGGLAVVAAAGLSVTAYRALAHEYRYFQWIELGDELLADGLAFQASRAYGSATRVDPTEPTAFVKRAYAEQQQGNLAPALADLETARALSSDLALVSLRLADLYYDLGRFDEAAAEYEALLSSDPEAPAILYKLGLVHFRAGRETEAIDALNRAASVRERFWEAYYLRGAAHRALGRSEEAEADYRSALRLAPDGSMARAALIELLLEDGRVEPALTLVQAEIDADPGAASAYLDLAEVHHAAGRRADAIEALALALEQDPNFPAAFLKLGELWLEEAERNGDPLALDKAVTALESVTKMEPDNGRASLGLGRAYLAAGDEPRGFAELERASRATPMPADAHRLLGDLYRARSNPDEAVTAYHVFLRLRGESSDVLERLGDTYVELNQSERAAETYLRLAELEPSSVAHLVKAAGALLRAGDTRGAARVCRQGLADNPEHPELVELLSQSEAGDNVAAVSVPR